MAFWLPGGAAGVMNPGRFPAGKGLFALASWNTRNCGLLFKEIAYRDLFALKPGLKTRAGYGLPESRSHGAMESRLSVIPRRQVCGI